MFYDKTYFALQSSDAKLAPKPLHAQEAAAVSRWGATGCGLLWMYAKHTIRCMHLRVLKELANMVTTHHLHQGGKGGPWCLENG